MLAKTHFAPTLTKRPLSNQSQKHLTNTLHQPAIKRVLTAGYDLLTVLTVVSGLPDSLENLDEMGVYLGPPHE
jgi:hypothetical protein